MRGKKENTVFKKEKRINKEGKKKTNISRMNNEKKATKNRYHLTQFLVS